MKRTTPVFGVKGVVMREENRALLREARGDDGGRSRSSGSWARGSGEGRGDHGEGREPLREGRGHEGRRQHSAAASKPETPPERARRLPGDFDEVALPSPRHVASGRARLEVLDLLPVDDRLAVNAHESAFGQAAE